MPVVTHHVKRRQRDNLSRRLSSQLGTLPNAVDAVEMVE